MFCWVKLLLVVLANVVPVSLRDSVVPFKGDDHCRDDGQEHLLYGGLADWLLVIEARAHLE